jgi:hypothetical protein
MYVVLKTSQFELGVVAFKTPTEIPRSLFIHVIFNLVVIPHAEQAL